MLGERIARVISRVLMNTLGLMLILGLVILTLGAREPFTVAVTVVALMVPVYVIVELAVALAKIEPPDAGRDRCGRTSAVLCFLVAALAIPVACPCVPKETTVATASRGAELPRFHAAVQALRQAT